MHIHILGIAGTFMAGLALLAKERGYTVTGQDSQIYPPMSTQLENKGIILYEGYDDSFLTKIKPGSVILVGNALSRGMPVIETLLNRRLPYQSGPQWLRENILSERWVIGVAGTHGKTTTSSMIAWMIEYAGFNPGFLIGGIPNNFEVSARLGDNPYFVIEADEYDTAFFDKRSKFLHYTPQTCIINNVEYDHADIFENIQAIYKQFHHLIRTVPEKGLVIRPGQDAHIDQILAQGLWTPVQTVGISAIDYNKNPQNSKNNDNKSNNSDWQACLLSEEGSAFEVYFKNQKMGEVHWELIGQHNVLNALAALAAVQHAGIRISDALAALSDFKSVKRRMEVLAQVNNITVYDDFAHHPTAIKTTLMGLADKLKNNNTRNRIIVGLDLRSNTMKKGTHKDLLADSLSLADKIVVLKTPDIQWNIQELVTQLGQDKITILEDPLTMAEHLTAQAQPYDHMVLMSNGAFGGMHTKVLSLLKNIA